MTAVLIALGLVLGWTAKQVLGVLLGQEARGSVPGYTAHNARAAVRLLRYRPTRSPPPSTDAIASWWVTDAAAGSPLERALDDFVPGWLAAAWGFDAVHYFP
jgi:hypothetical protein